MTEYHPADDPEEKLSLICGLRDKAIEHFDSVLILCTGSTDDGTGATTLFKCQGGNVHAHEGAVREWLREQEAYQNAYFAHKGTKDAKEQDEQ